MELTRRLLMAMLVALLSLGAVACDAEGSVDDGGIEGSVEGEGEGEEGGD